MPKTTFTYGLLDERLRELGFASHTKKGKMRIYKHERTGASIILPDAPFDEEVIPHHLAVIRHVLREHDLDGTASFIPSPEGGWIDDY